MSGIQEPKLQSMSELFSGNKRYEVPRYQRNFDWSKDEVEELWEDIRDAKDIDRDYFLGTIVLQRTDQPTVYQIIDGQQRLACVTMIFSAIRNVLLTANDDRAGDLRKDFLGARKNWRRSDDIMDLIPKLKLNRINESTFVEFVLDSANVIDVDKVLKNKKAKPHNSNVLLLGAYKYILGEISKEVARLGTTSDDFIAPLIECLYNRIKLISIPVDTDEDANTFFESLNARGKDLAVSDLVKNRLYLEAGTQLEYAVSHWEKMENELATRRSIPEYIRHFWIAKRADLRNLTVRERKLYRAIKREVRNDPTKAQSLVKELSESTQDYLKISDYSLWPEGEPYDLSFEESLNDLKLFGVTQCHPLLLNAIQLYDKPKEIAKAFRLVANFSFRYFIIGNQSPGNLERESGRIAYKIRNRDFTSANDLAQALLKINPDETFRADFELANISRRRGKVARYLLARINNYIEKQKQPSENVVDPNAKNVNLEHVLPQSLNKHQNWKPDFSSDELDSADYIYRIGNLTLLNAKVNRTNIEDSFAEKKQEAFEPSVLPINSYIKQQTKWGDVQIKNRQKWLAKRALARTIHQLIK